MSMPNTSLLHCLLAALALTMLCRPVSRAEHVDLCIAGNDAGWDNASLAPSTGVKATLTRAPLQAPDSTVAATATLTFAKDSSERRLLALELPLPNGVPAETAALEANVRLAHPPTLTARLAILFFTADGDAWYAAGRAGALTGVFARNRLSLKSLQRAAFSQGTTDRMIATDVRKAWLGLILDGTGAGELQIRDATLTSRPYVPTTPQPAFSSRLQDWQVSADNAVAKTLGNDAGPAPDSKAVQFDFTFPGGRHMYAVPSQTVHAEDISAYTALRLTYRAALPPGIETLLVMLIEESGGTQYCATPGPPASTDWNTATIPFTAFKRGGWSPDENDRLDLDQVARIAVGAHGTASGEGGRGSITVSAIEFVPAASTR